MGLPVAAGGVVEGETSPEINGLLDSRQLDRVTTLVVCLIDAARCEVADFQRRVGAKTRLKSRRHLQVRVHPESHRQGKANAGVSPGFAFFQTTWRDANRCIIVAGEGEPFTQGKDVCVAGLDGLFVVVEGNVLEGDVSVHRFDPDGYSWGSGLGNAAVLDSQAMVLAFEEQAGIGVVIPRLASGAKHGHMRAHVVCVGADLDVIAAAVAVDEYEIAMGACSVPSAFSRPPLISTAPL
jgi:hypothetical protein